MGLKEDKYIFGKQADAAFQLYKKNNSSINFIRELLFYSSNFHILTDAPNITGENFPGFKDHRHDQSILSLLAIKYNIKLTKSPRRFNEHEDQIFDLKRDVKKISEADWNAQAQERR